MAEIIDALTDGVTFKAPSAMSGPNIHRLKQEVMASFEQKPKAIVIDFDKVDYIDVHGLVLFQDLCEIIRVYGAKTFAYRLKPKMRYLLDEFDLLTDLGTVKPEKSALKTA
jgi:anti-anti-sigma regulatory factor